SPVEALLEVAQAEIRAMQAKIEAELTKDDEDERARAELGLGTPTHEMRLVQRYLTAAYNRAEKAKKLINKHGANNRQAINPLQRPGPKWRPGSQRAEGAGNYTGVAAEHITANGPVGRPGEPIAEAVADPQPAPPAATPTIPTASMGSEGSAE